MSLDSSILLFRDQRHLACPTGPPRRIPLERVIADLLELVAERNPGFYEYDEEAGRLVRA
jgi:hypothetical protein